MPTYLGKTPSALSLTKGSKAIAQAIYDAASDFGVSISYWMGGKHPFAKLERDNKAIRVSFSGTPGDNVHAARNQAGLTKRLCLSQGWSPISQKPQELIVTNLASTGKGSMFDAQQPSTGPASPVKHIPANLDPEIEVAGIHMPRVTEVAKLNAGKRGAPSPEYQKFLDARTDWVAKCIQASPNRRVQDVYKDCAAALSLRGYSVTASTLAGALSALRRSKEDSKAQAEGVPTRVRRAPEPQITVDAAKVASILSNPPPIPDFARKVYGYGALPYAVRSWGAQVRYPWAVKAFDAGATTEQVANALRKAGHPISDGAADIVNRRWRQERFEESERQRIAAELQAQREAAKAKREAAKTKRTETLPGPSGLEEAWNDIGGDEPNRARPAPTPASIPGGMGPIIDAIQKVVDAQVAAQLQGLDIETLKRKAAKWDAYQLVKEARAKLAALGDDE